MITFGPVPSRRLGRSLGVNNIPPKLCSYSCVYCQVGRTLNVRAQRGTFYEAKEILEAVKRSLEKPERNGEPPDYISLVPDGEPTLDRNLGRTIELLKPLGIKIAVISNGSLMTDRAVRKALGLADWVSLKVDSTHERTWRRTDRPHRSLELRDILNGMLAFREVFSGELATETMLVKDINDGEDDIAGVAEFLGRLQPDKAYLSIPTRPPAEKRAEPPEEDVLNRAYQQLSEKVDHVEYLIGYEGNAFSSSGNVQEDLLSITAVHPMREDAVQALLDRVAADDSAVRGLVDRGLLLEAEYGGRRFYVRRFPRRSADGPTPPAERAGRPET